MNSTIKTFITFLLLNFVVITAGAQNLAWAKAMGATGDDAPNAIATDVAGNVYTTGYFEGTVDFDPGAGTYNLAAAGKKDIFISKLDASGNFQWAIAFGDTGTDRGRFIVTDASGNIYVAGHFSGTIDFDPGPGSNTLSSLTGMGLFILKINSSGNLTWAKGISNSSSTVQEIALATDLSGNVYATGAFANTVDFDPGSGIYNVTYPVAGGFGSFVLKLDASGNFVWVRATGAFIGYPLAGTISSSKIAVDAAQNVYTAGRFVAAVDFDPSPATYTLNSTLSSYDVYVSKLDANGNFVWAKAAVTGSDNDWCSSLILDASANIYICGLFGSTVDLDPGAGTYTFVTAGSYDAFVSKLDSAGNLTWAKSFGGTGSDGAYSLARDLSGNIYTTGWFNGTADFDTGINTYTLSSAGNFDLFISKLDPGGNFILAQSMGGTGIDGGNSIAVDGLGNIVVTGLYNGTCDLDPSPAVLNVTSAGDNDIFVAKFGNCSFAITSQPANQASTVGNTVQFVIAASNSPAFQWQENAGNGFVNLANLPPYSGATSATLTIGNLMLSQNNYSFRCVTTQSACINTSGTALLNVSNPTGIETADHKSLLAIYPNPATDLITIRTSNAAADAYTICDQTGKEIMYGKLQGTETSINIASLAAGLYFISTGTAHKKTLKLIKH